MRIIKTIFGVVMASVITLTLSSCDKETENPNYEKLIQGEWIAESIDNKKIDNDNTHYLRFADGKQDYAVGYIYENGDKEWKENKDYDYKLEDKKITIIGVNVNGDSTHLETEFVSADSDYMAYKVISLKYNGKVVEEETGLTYKFRKVKEDLNILGMWQGSEKGTEDVRKWEFLENGSFKYYYQKDGEFVEKEDNNGKYFLYGDFLVTVYSNDLDLGGTKRNYECWNLTLDSNKLTWKSNNDGKERVLEMTK